MKKKSPSTELYEDLNHIQMNEQIVKSPQDWKIVFEKVNKIFSTVRVPYAIIGAVALAAQTKIRRNTDDIDINSEFNNRKKIHDEILKHNFILSEGDINDSSDMKLVYQCQDTMIDLDMLYFQDMEDPEESVVELARKVNYLGFELRFATPTCIAFALLFSDQTKHHGDLINLINNKEIDEKQLNQFLSHYPEELKLYNKLRMKAAQEKINVYKLKKSERLERARQNNKFNWELNE